MWFRRIFRLASLLPKPRGVTEKDRPNELVQGLSPSALSQLERLQIRGSKALRGDRTGNRTSSRSKPAMEFREHRMYVPGDDLRFVDWRASARHETIFVRQGEMPKDVIVSILLDCSASMQWGKKEKRHAQLSIASALGYAALTNGDRLFVYPYGEIQNPKFGLASGKGYLSSFISYLNQLKYGGQSDLEQAARGLTQRISRGGVVFIISDLLEKGNLSTILSTLPAPRWWVNVIHVLHPAELNPEVRGRFELEDSETGRLVNFDLTNEAIRKYQDRVIEWRSRLELAAVAHHALYFLVESDWSLSREILPYLREHQVLVN